jgi:drug/metabolite transporter (DMT)-like permease
VVVNAVLASIFLGEVLNRDGKIGCALCIIGSVIIVLHSPPEETITSTSQLLQYALRPGIKNLT